MHPYPHLYTVHATAEPTGDVPLNSPGLPALPTAPLDRVDGRTYFTEIVVHATLRVPAGTDRDRATKLLEKSEHVCLVSNSLVARRRLEPAVIAG